MLISEEWAVVTRKVRLHGVRINGCLALQSALLRCPLHLESCLLDEPVCLDQATAMGLTFTGCHLAGLAGELLTAKAIDLSGSTLAGPLRLQGADITGALICRGTRLTGCDNDGNSPVADGINAGCEGVLLDGRLKAAGAVRLTRAAMTDTLSRRIKT